MTFKDAVTRIARNSVIAGAFLSTAVAAFGQAGRGAISGLITDPSGAIVPGARVTANEQATGTKLSTVSTAAGIYTFVSLSPGKYQVTVGAKGFETVVQKNVDVTLDQVSTVNVTLTLGNQRAVLLDQGNAAGQHGADFPLGAFDEHGAAVLAYRVLDAGGQCDWFLADTRHSKFL